MALSTEDLISTQIRTVGFTVLDHAVLAGLTPNWDGSSAIHFDRSRTIQVLLSTTEIEFFRAWIGKRSQPVLVATRSGRNLSRRIEYLVGQPVRVEPIATEDVRQSIESRPESPPHSQGTSNRQKVHAQRQAEAAMKKAEQAVVVAEAELAQAQDEPRHLSTSELEIRLPDIEARIKRQEEAVRQARAALAALQNDPAP